MKKLIFLLLVLVISACVKLEDSRNITFISREASKNTLKALNNINDWAKKNKLTSKDSLRAAQKFEKIILDFHISSDLLKDLNKTKRIENGELVTIKYSYYKNGVCEMTMPDGTKDNFIFKDVAVNIKRPTGTTICVDLRSLNEISIATKPDISVDGPIEFYINKGENIFSYLPHEWAIMAAEAFGLPIFKGREFFKEDQISPDEARMMMKHRSGPPRLSIYTEPLYEFHIEGPDFGKWKLNGLSPDDFKDGFSPNFIKTKKMRPPEHERRRR